MSNNHFTTGTTFQVVPLKRINLIGERKPHQFEKDNYTLHSWTMTLEQELLKAGATVDQVDIAKGRITTKIFPHSSDDLNQQQRELRGLEKFAHYVGGSGGFSEYEMIPERMRTLTRDSIVKEYEEDLASNQVKPEYKLNVLC